MKLIVNQDTYDKLKARLESTTDPAERKLLENTLGEARGEALTGDAHGREGADGTS